MSNIDIKMALQRGHSNKTAAGWCHDYGMMLSPRTGKMMHVKKSDVIATSESVRALQRKLRDRLLDTRPAHRGNSETRTANRNADIAKKQQHHLGGNVYYCAISRDECDWKYYPKSYGHPRVTKKFSLEFYVFDKWGNYKTVKANPEHFRGNYLLGHAVGLGLITPGKGKKHIRLHEAYNIELRRHIGPVEIWERTLLGTFVDFCAVYDGYTYHAAKIADAVNGLNEKIKLAKMPLEEKTFVTFDSLRRLHFCTAGITAAAEFYGLDVANKYSIKQIQDAVKQNGVGGFAKELKIIGAI